MGRRQQKPVDCVCSAGKAVQAGDDWQTVSTVVRRERTIVRQILRSFSVLTLLLLVLNVFVNKPICWHNMTNHGPGHLYVIRSSLWLIHCGTSSQCSLEWPTTNKPQSNFHVPLTTRAAVFVSTNTGWF